MEGIIHYGYISKKDGPIIACNKIKKGEYVSHHKTNITCKKCLSELKQVEKK